jgi:hypothetical protein
LTNSQPDGYSYARFTDCLEVNIEITLKANVAAEGNDAGCALQPLGGPPLIVWLVNEHAGAKVSPILPLCLKDNYPNYEADGCENKSQS